jgi:hypothetical protein
MPDTPEGSGFKVDPGSGDGWMSLMIVEGKDTASKIAAGVLAGAKKSFELSGKPRLH